MNNKKVQYNFSTPSSILTAQQVQLNNNSLQQKQYSHHMNPVISETNTHCRNFPVLLQTHMVHSN